MFADLYLRGAGKLVPLVFCLFLKNTIKKQAKNYVSLVNFILSILQGLQLR